MNDAITTETVLHPWEKAGLGKAPFKYLGYERKVGPIRYPNGMEVGAPGQPMGKCDYCGQGIADCFVVKSADDKRFIVGCDCITKVYDKRNTKEPLVRMVSKLKTERAKEARVRKAENDKTYIQEMLNSATVRELLAVRPHPRFEGKTLLDYVEWMWKNAGAKGRADVVKVLKDMNYPKRDCK